MPDDYTQAFNALYGKADAAEAEYQKEAKPIAAGAQKALDQPMPPVPGTPGGEKLPEIPQAPQSNIAQDGQQWILALAFLAGIGGAMTRRHGTNALTAFSAAINGFKQGKMDVYAQQYKTWEAENKKAIEETEQIWKKRQAILDDRTSNIDTQIAKLKLLEASTGNKVAYETTRVGDFNSFTLQQEQMKIRLQQMKDASDKIKQANDNGARKFKQATGMDYEEFDRQWDDIQRVAMSQKPANLTPEQWAGTAKYKEITDREWQKRKMSAGGAGSVDDGMVAQRATGEPANQIIGGWGGVQQRIALNKGAIDLIKQQNPGMNDQQAGAELAMRDTEYTSGRRSVGQLTTMLGATKQAVDQLDFNVKKATEEMNKLGGLGSTNLAPIFNAIARGEEKWTGDPAYSSLFFYVNASAMESARLLSGGQASIAQLHEGARAEAQNWADVNMTPAQWVSVSNAMKAEGQERVKNFTDAIDFQRGRMGGAAHTPTPGGAVTPPPQTPPTPGATPPPNDGGWGQLQVQ